MVFARNIHVAMTALALLAMAGDVALAQTKVRTETIRPPGAQANPQTAAEKPGDTQAKPSPKPTPPSSAAPPEIITDLSRLPQPVARMRERILAAAKSGELKKLVTAMQTNETMPIFSLGEDKDPAAFWRTTYPDSEGVEVLAILLGILEAPYVHVEKGTPQEMYLWPYFARMPLKTLTLAVMGDYHKGALPTTAGAARGCGPSAESCGSRLPCVTRESGLDTG